MGISEKEKLEKEKIKEIFPYHYSLPIIKVSKAMKSLCKIQLRRKDNSIFFGSGFFLRVTNSSKYLITCYHIINLIKNNKEINIEIHNKQTYKLTLNDRYIKCLEHPQDITAIEIKDSDNIYKDIEFLDYDPNYIKGGYSIYLDANCFLFHSLFKEWSINHGKIFQIENNQFSYYCPIDGGSSGSPIILYNNNSGMIYVIGIHCYYEYSKRLNIGTFIGAIINELDLNINNANKNKIFTSSKKSEVNNNNNGINNINQNSCLTNNTKIEFTLDITKKNIINMKEDTKEIITLYFKSSDQLLSCKVLCKSSDKFNTIVNTIFDKVPRFIEIPIFFLCNGNKINEYKTIKDNGLKDGNIIILKILDE